MSGPQGPQEQSSTRLTGSGSQQPEPRFLAIGRIVRAHGIKGELSVAVLTDFPERFEDAEWIYLGDKDEVEAYRLEGSRWHKKNVLLKLAEVNDRTLAQQLTGLYVQVPIEEAVPLPEGSYYLYQLIGLHVVTEQGESLGTVSDIIETKANDVYVVRDADARREILLPAISQVVKRIDLENGQIVVELIDGLI